jgi:hypothetical protein
MQLRPVSPDLTLDEAMALACSHRAVFADVLDCARLSTPLERKVAAAEARNEGAVRELEDPALPPEFVEYDRIVEAHPDATMWELRFGRMEYLDASEIAFQYEKEFRIVGRDVLRSLPAAGKNQLDPEQLIAARPAIPFGLALDLASRAVGMPRAMAHGAWYSTARMIESREPDDPAPPSGPQLPHWTFLFRIEEGLHDEVFASKATATATVSVDGRVHATQDWKWLLRRDS